MVVSPKSSILVGFSLINNPFWVSPFMDTPQFSLQIQHLLSFWSDFPLTSKPSSVGISARPGSDHLTQTAQVRHVPFTWWCWAKKKHGENSRDYDEQKKMGKSWKIAPHIPISKIVTCATFKARHSFEGIMMIQSILGGFSTAPFNYQPTGVDRSRCENSDSWYMDWSFYILKMLVSPKSCLCIHIFSMKCFSWMLFISLITSFWGK